MPGITLPLEDIQGLILSGYAHLSHAGYVMLEVTDRLKAKRWLARIVGETTSAKRWDKKPETCLNIAFTCQGLAALGLPEEVLKTFAVEFREGMAEPIRAELMGDIGESAPATWDYGGTSTPDIHLVLILFGLDETRLDAYRNQHRARFEEGGLRELCSQNGYRTSDSHEHFGFFDGISQPTLEGAAPMPKPTDIAPGEFLFGYPNEYGLKSPVPGLSALNSGVLGQNGSYLVYRKLAQDVGAFQKLLKEKTDGSPTQMEYLSAKMVGRWPSGAPLVLAPDKDDPALGVDETRHNAFTYAQTDPHGYACPIGAHIRRTNPRDSLEPDPPSSQITVNRHRIIRRGRSYGPLYSEANANTPRGVVFIAINADIKRQFEFIQQAWINDERFNGLYDNKDPIVADRREKYPTCSMILQRSPIRKQVEDIPRLVTVRGGGYFFVPSITALKYLADRP